MKTRCLLHRNGKTAECAATRRSGLPAARKLSLRVPRNWKLFPPRKPTRHGSILNRESSTDKKKIERSISQTHDFDPTDSSSRKPKSSWDESRHETYGLVQRCVIIQRDENGFGLTVSGDNPVFVQSVKDDGAAMRAGVQTGDRIIKVNGTLVTRSNHLEVVQLIKSGSYVALTVQGRPPGSPQIPLADSELESIAFGQNMSPHSPGTTVNSERITSPVLMVEENSIVHSQKVEILRKMLQQELEQLQSLQEDYGRAPSSRLFKEIQEAKKHIPQLQEQLSKATGLPQDAVWSCRPGSESLQIHEVEPDISDGLGKIDYSIMDGSRPNSDNTDSPWSGLKEKNIPEESAEKSELHDTDSQSSIGSPHTRSGPQIIGAEDEDFDAEQEQINGQCSCFQSMDLLKSRPAHLAVFVHHVVSLFDPSTLLCFLYTDLYQQTNPKESRRVFQEFHQLFMERNANLKVSVPEDIAMDLEKRRPDLIPEDLHRVYIQNMQEKVSPEVQKHLEDFRQKRSMGLTLAESDLTRLDAERLRDKTTLEKERACAEQIIVKIEEVLMTSQPLEEEKSSAIQYVILTYMKHLGVKVKEPRNLEQKRGRIGFLPKIKSIKEKKDREGDEKCKRRGFPSILGPQRRISRHDSNAIGRAMDMHKQRHPKHPPTSSSSSPEPGESSRVRQSVAANDGPDGSHPSSGSMSPLAVGGYGSAEGGKENETGLKQAGESVSSADSFDSTPRTPINFFDFSSPVLDHLQEEESPLERFSELGTPKSYRKLDSMAFGDIHSEDECYDFDVEIDPPNWQQLVGRDVLQGMKPHEIKQQEVIHELFYTERAHVRTLTVLDQVFYQRLSRETILTPAEIRGIFCNLDEILHLHVGLNDQMKAIRKRNETSVVDQIGDDLLSWFSGAGEEQLKQATATFCSNQPFALEMIKSRQKKDSRFLAFVQDAESNPLCRRLQLKDFIPTEMQRLTKYPLLLDNIAKYSDRPDEKEKVKNAADHCRQILHCVNQAVKEAEHKQHLEDYQRRLDLSNLKQSECPMLDEYKTLDLTKKKMIHEGHLTWKVNREKTIDLYTLLLEDILVLLQKQDDKLVLRSHNKILPTTGENKQTFSPIIKLSTVLVRQVATDNKAFFVISMSDNGAQIYELVAQTVSEKNVWQDLIARMAVKVETFKKPIPLPQVPPGIVSEDEHEEEEDHKLKEDAESSPVTRLLNQDKHLDEESYTHSGKHQAGQENEAVRQDSREEPLSTHTIAMEPVCSLRPTMELPFPVLEQCWALDALRNVGLLRQILLHQLVLSKNQTTVDLRRVGVSRTTTEAASMNPGVSISQSHPDTNIFQLETDNFSLSGRIADVNACPRPALDQGAKQRVRSFKMSGKRPNCTVKSAAEGGADKSGEKIFDAPEACIDANEVEGTVRKDELELQLRISGNYLILDGCEYGQESSTDEEFSTIQHSTGGGCAMDYSSPNTSESIQMDPGGSPFPGLLQPEEEIPLFPGATLHTVNTTSSGGMWTNTSSSPLLGGLDTDTCSSPLDGGVWTDTSGSPMGESGRGDTCGIPYPGDILQRHTGLTEEPESSAERTNFSAESCGQILQYLQKIEAGLLHLKGVEEEYYALQRRLAGSAHPDQLSGES
ncbi:rho guanine nucleotide exchange factor 12 isoform X2 [Ambystoma mexicanum]|uniref:rho guanine nucleotide exchange factor 12 isoform X2 n=1 Tax=Ambystoma mexicanum TaxID=8296 RepID=UPI0037E8029C